MPDYMMSREKNDPVIVANKDGRKEEDLGVENWRPVQNKDRWRNVKVYCNG